MSRASKITLGVTTLTATATIYWVHRVQKQEQEALHMGIVRDQERIRVKKERQDDFDMQKKLREEYAAVQNVAPDLSPEIKSSNSTS